MCRGIMMQASENGACIESRDRHLNKLSMYLLDNMWRELYWRNMMRLNGE